MVRLDEREAPHYLRAETLRDGTDGDAGARSELDKDLLGHVEGPHYRLGAGDRSAHCPGKQNKPQRAKGFLGAHESPRVMGRVVSEPGHRSSGGAPDHRDLNAKPNRNIVNAPNRRRQRCRS